VGPNWLRPHNLNLGVGGFMIKLVRLNGEEVTVNADLIETVKSTPDTIVELTTHKRILVEESVDDVIEKVIDYKRKIFNSLMLDEE